MSTLKILNTLPFWDRLTPEEKEMVIERSSIKEFEKNQIINTSDSSCMGIVIVLSGGIRISLLSDEGREITLYRLTEGNCCITTASCVIRQITFDTIVSAAENARLLVIPADICLYLSEKNVYARLFMYETETERFSQAIWVIQQMLFRRFDQRLAAYLISAFESSGSTDLKITQEEIARDVNSAREVVARMLRHFSSEGLVEAKRGRIILLDPDGLRNLM